jgi:hypothetical protein
MTVASSGQQNSSPPTSTLLYWNHGKNLTALELLTDSEMLVIFSKLTGFTTKEHFLVY